MKARYLRRATLEELRDAVPDNIEIYRSGSFQYLDTDFTKFFAAGLDVDEVCIDSFRPPDPGQYFEEDNCLACYGALPGLTPYEARDERLWAHLTHTRLLKYTRQRWPIPMEDAVAVPHIRQHFFAKDKRAIERDNAASRLWWMAYLCQRIPQLSLPDALQVLLYRSDVRANIIERPTASQSIAVFSAVVKKLHASYIAEKKLFERSVFRPFMIRINSIGGIKLLDCMSEKQITELIDHVVKADLKLASL
jgi:hypothetical protein